MTVGIADLSALDRRSQQKAWNWYDWANSALYTTVFSAVFSPFMITVAGKAAGCADADDTCRETVNVLGLQLAAGSLPLYLTSFATILSAFLLPIVGAIVDRSARKKWHMAGYGWSGAFFCALLFTLKDDDWQVAAVAVVLASVLAGCSLICYYAILVDISTEDERDSASARGWAWGYLGGGILLTLNLAMISFDDKLGLSSEMAARLSLLSAAVWWAAFTIIPVVRLRNYAPVDVVRREGSLMQRSFGQLVSTLKELPRYPQTLTFLLAYLFFNDGIQTVIYSASIYGTKQLGFESEVLVVTVLMIQFLAFGGALLFGRIAQRTGSYKPILYGVYGWIAIVVMAFFLPEKNVVLFFSVGILIAVVMGGTQALSRSFYSLLIPRGREGEYFALYAACERGTSWFGMLLFGLIFQLTGSYRPAILALVLFFVLGAFFLLRLDPQRGIEDAGNRPPAVM